MDTSLQKVSIFMMLNIQKRLCTILYIKRCVLVIVMGYVVSCFPVVYNKFS